MAFSATLFDRFSEVGDEWRAVDPMSPLFLSERWMQSVENTIAADHRYAVVRDTRGVAVAAAAFYRVDASAYYFFNPISLVLDSSSLTSLDAWIGDEAAAAHDLAARVAARREDFAPATICGSLFGYTPALIYSPALSTGERRGVLDVILRAFDATAQEWRTPTRAFLYAAVEDEVLWEALTERGGAPYVAAAECILPIVWGDFDAYLASLSQSARRHVRRDQRLFDESGITLEYPDLASAAGDVAFLQASLQAKHGHEFDVDAQLNVLSRIQRLFSDSAHVILARRDNHVVGASLFYFYEGVVYLKMNGYDYDSLSFRDSLYFVMNYNELVRFAIREKASAIQYGPEAYVPKARRGCRLEDRTCFIEAPDVPESRDLIALLSEANRRRFSALRSGDPLVDLRSEG